MVRVCGSPLPCVPLPCALLSHMSSPCLFGLPHSFRFMSSLPSLDSQYTSLYVVMASIGPNCNYAEFAITVCAQYSMHAYPRSDSTASTRRPQSNLPRGEMYPERPKSLMSCTGHTQPLAGLISLSRESFLTRRPTNTCRHVPIWSRQSSILSL